MSSKRKKRIEKPKQALGLGTDGYKDTKILVDTSWAIFFGRTAIHYPLLILMRHASLSPPEVWMRSGIRF